MLPAIVTTLDWSLAPCGILQMNRCVCFQTRIYNVSRLSTIVSRLASICGFEMSIALQLCSESALSAKLVDSFIAAIMALRIIVVDARRLTVVRSLETFYQLSGTTGLTAWLARLRNKFRIRHRRRDKTTQLTERCTVKIFVYPPIFCAEFSIFMY